MQRASAFGLIVQLSLCLALAAGLSACGDKSAGGGGAGGGGAGGGGAGGGGAGGGVVGAWTIDFPATVKNVEASMAAKMAKVSEEERQMMAGMKDMIVEQMAQAFKETGATLELKTDKTFSASMPSGPGKVEAIAGTWSMDGGNVIVTAVTNNGAPASEADKKPMTLVPQGGLLVMRSEDDGPALVFKRK